jgi:hypothetical protein
MIRKATSQQPDLQHYKQVFEGSLNRLNGDAVPVSKQPIFRPKQQAMSTLESSKAAIEAAANSLAALWQISSPRRHTV